MEKIELDREFVRGWLAKPPLRTMYLDDGEYEAAMRIEEDYYENERPKVNASVQAMIEEMDPDKRSEMRRTYILEQISLKKLQYLETNDPKVERELKRLIFEAKVFTGETQGIDQEQIIRARQFPIERLIKHRLFMAICPFHKDKTPSLNIRKNFFFCHGCNEHGDVIDFVMKRDGVTFKQAVELLASGNYKSI